MPKAICPKIMARMRNARKQSGLSYSKLAALVGCSRQNLYEIETGTNPNPTIASLKSIAKHLGVTVGWLIGETS